MKSQKLSLVFVLGLIALTLPLRAEDLRLKLDVAKRDVAAGLPIVLNVAVSTAGDAVDLPAISPEAGNVHVYVEDPSGATKRYLGPRWGIDEAAPDRYPVTADEPLRRSIALLFHNVIEGRDDLSDTQLPFVPARYRIIVEYFGAGHEAPLRDSVDVVVRPPATPGERAYWEALTSDPDLAASIQTGNFARHPDRLATAEQLLREHPEPEHAAVTALAVGSHALRVNNDARKAETILSWAADREADAFVHRRVLRELAGAQTVLRKFDDAAATIEKALSSTSDREFSKELLQLREILVTGEARDRR